MRQEMRQGGILKRKKEEKWVRVCPRCGSILHFNDDISLRMGLLTDVYQCQNCSYRGFPIDVKADELKKIKFKLDMP